MSKLTEEEIEHEKSLYTRKMYTPIYEPKGKCPDINSLCDYTKRNELIVEINNDKDLNPQLREFLLSAAERHVAFDFARIAEYYSHIPVKYKHHFENSGLVIIDHDSAIRNGFVAYQKEVEISRLHYLENVLTEEKMIEVRDAVAQKRIDRLQEEYDYLKEQEEQRDEIELDEW